MSEKLIEAITIVSYFIMAACHSPLRDRWPAELVLLLLYLLLGLCHACIALQDRDPRDPRNGPPWVLPPAD